MVLMIMINDVLAKKNSHHNSKQLSLHKEWDWEKNDFVNMHAYRHRHNRASI